MRPLPRVPYCTRKGGLCSYLKQWVSASLILTQERVPEIFWFQIQLLQVKSPSRSPDIGVDKINVFFFEVHLIIHLTTIFNQCFLNMFNDKHLRHFKACSQALLYLEGGWGSPHQTIRPMLFSRPPSDNYHFILGNSTITSHVLGIDLNFLMKIKMENVYVECKWI